MLKLATILDNPGEPSAETRYRDSQHLADLGYNALVLYGTTGLSGVESVDCIASSEMRWWVAQQFQFIRDRIEAARKAKLQVFITYDTISLARGVVEEQVGELTCKKRPTSLCPGSEATMQFSAAALESLLQQLPEVDGVVLRFGDNDAARLPYLVGNDIYTPHCARCNQLGRADRIASVLHRFHDLVVGKLGRRLIARAWNVRPNGMHDAVELCQRLRNRLPGEPGDDRFLLSFKFTQTDFWRYQRWNPCSLVFNDRPIIYELQCQREFEGKGGIANWQAPLWRDGGEEWGDEAMGLVDVAERVKVAGLWAWVRGGGWGGPFVSNETWIDANVYAVPILADRPDTPLAELADRWITERLGVSDGKVASAIRRVLEASPQFIRKAFYIGALIGDKQNGWHPNADWIQDDLVDANSAWRTVQRMSEASLDAAVAEKQEAVDLLADARAALQHQVDDSNARSIEPLVNTLVYAESLFQSLRDLLAGLVAYRRWQKSQDAAAGETCRQRLLAAQSHWAHHTQRHGSLPGAATAFREAGLWELTQQMLGDVG